MSRPLARARAQRLVGRAAFEVAALGDAEGRRLFRSRHDLVVLVDVVDGPAVGDDVAVEAPLLPQDVLEEALARRARLAVDAVVGAHHRVGLALLDEGLERGKVGLPEIALARLHVEGVPLRLGAAVDGEVLGGGDHLEVARVVALQALHERDAHARGKEGVLAVGLLAATPSRVAEDVDVRRPEREALVAPPLPARRELVVLGPSFVGDGGGHLLQEGSVERGGEPDGLGKDRGRSRPRHAVKALVPPLVGRDLEPRDRRGVVRELRDLLFRGHARHEVRRAPLEVDVGVEVGRAGGARLGVADGDGPESRESEREGSCLGHLRQAYHSSRVADLSVNRR